MFTSRYANLSATLDTLRTQDASFVIGGSGALYLFGNDRLPDDVDIFVADADHDRLDQAFNIESFTYKSLTENVRNSNPFGDHDMQITSHLTITLDGQSYNLSLTPEVLAHAKTVQSPLGPLPILPPEDVLLIKALLQRGPEVGKHDIADIKNFLKIYQPDMEYLQSRIAALNAQARVGTIFG